MQRCLTLEQALLAKLPLLVQLPATATTAQDAAAAVVHFALALARGTVRGQPGPGEGPRALFSPTLDLDGIAAAAADNGAAAPPLGAVAASIETLAGQIFAGESSLPLLRDEPLARDEAEGRPVGPRALRHPPPATRLIARHDLRSPCRRVHRRWLSRLRPPWR